VDLPVRPPLPPMLARLARTLPLGAGWSYEPKWDGFRCLAFCDAAAVDLRSRNGRPLARYFPELVEALLALPTSRFVLDGEIVVTGPRGFDFPALLQRLHPAASRVERLRRETPGAFIAFDLLAVGDDDLRAEAFTRRRARLEGLLEAAPAPLHLTPVTDDPGAAGAWLEDAGTSGIDGVVAKHADLRYEPGKRAMVKVKLDRTADCVVGGFRWHGGEEAVGSLLLGLYDGDVLRHAGITAAFSGQRRRELLEDVRGDITPLAGHPWEHGFALEASPVGRLPGAVSRWQPGRELTWVPLRPERVCEVAYDHLQGDRFRHAPRFRRWRPDRNPRSCTYDQFTSTRDR
jgi:ATP-dependent DNA ligase